MKCYQPPSVSSFDFRLSVPLLSARALQAPPATDETGRSRTNPPASNLHRRSKIFIPTHNTKPTIVSAFYLQATSAFATTVPPRSDLQGIVSTSITWWLIRLRRFDFGFRSLFLSMCVIDKWTPTTAPTRTITNIAEEPFLRADGSLGF
nr:hypothetical protein CFP56_40114 [Quercus suber]